MKGYLYRKQGNLRLVDRVRQYVEHHEEIVLACYVHPHTLTMEELLLKEVDEVEIRHTFRLLMKHLWFEVKEEEGR